MFKYFFIFLAIFTLGNTGISFSQSVQEPVGLMLTWQQDPTTTMTIDWHSLPENGSDTSLYYREKGKSDWLELQTEQFAFPYSDRTVHRVELTGLEPDTDYEFRVGEFIRIYSFYTMPEEKTRPIRFLAGGDTHQGRDGMNRVAMTYDPDFIIWGGDLAYADGMEARLDLWYSWFEKNINSLISDEGRVVPIVVAVGNHELKRYIGGSYYHQFDNFEDSDEWRATHSPYLMQLFAFPGQPGYNVLDFGDYLSFIVLDTDHLNPIVGKQTNWLETVISERQHVSNIFPIYHTPAYPSHRSFDESFSRDIRRHWIPLFEQYGVEVAFENHDHTYKRTHPILDGAIDTENGIVFIGDGNWGRNPRAGDNQDAWYINQFASVIHGIVVTLTEDDTEFLAVDHTGLEFDYYATSFKKSMPSEVYPISPEQAASGIELRPVFVWEASENADETTTYELEISTHSQFNDISYQIVNVTGITDTEYKLEEDLDEQKIYFWRVRARNFAGYSNWSEVRSFFTFEDPEPDPTSAEDEGDFPTRIVLYQNSPNPFNPYTLIRFGLPEETDVHLEVFNMSGQRVSSVIGSRISAGYHQVLFDASHLSSGTYLYRLQTSEYSESRTFTLIK